MTLRDITHLAERYKEEQEIINRRVGRLCAVLANFSTRQRKGNKPFTEDDFIPKKKEEKKAMSDDEMFVVGQMIVAAYGGEDRRPKNE